MLGSVVIDHQLEMSLLILLATNFETAFTVLASWVTETTVCCLCWTSGSPCVARVCRFDPSSVFDWFLWEKDPLKLEVSLFVCLFVCLFFFF